MKNIAVLPVLVIIVTALTANNWVYSQDLENEKNYCFTFGTEFGFIRGTALELVYPVDTKGEFLSELRWDMKPVFYYGAQFDFGHRDLMSGPGFSASISFKAGVPGDSGIMEDRDWMSQVNGNLTHFSSHINKTHEFYWLDAAIGASFPIKTYFYIIPFISGSWMHFSFTGRDGKIKYARVKSVNPDTYYPIDENPTEISFIGDDIHYMQNWLLLAAGFSIGTKFLSRFSFDFSFQISPLTYCASIDEHLSRELTFIDFTGWGLFLEPAGRLSFYIEKLEFSVDLAYSYIGNTRGQTYMKQGNGNFNRAGGEAGAGLSMLSSHFLVRVRI